MQEAVGKRTEETNGVIFLFQISYALLRLDEERGSSILIKVVLT